MFSHKIYSFVVEMLRIILTKNNSKEVFLHFCQVHARAKPSSIDFV